MGDGLSPVGPIPVDAPNWAPVVFPESAAMSLESADMDLGAVRTAEYLDQGKSMTSLFLDQPKSVLNLRRLPKIDNLEISTLRWLQ